MSDNHNISGNKYGAAIFGFSFAIGLIISAFIIAGAMKSIKKIDQAVSVKGYAEKQIKADLAVWKMNFSVSSTDMVSAYDRLQSNLDKILPFLEKNGISKDQITVNAVDSRPVYRISDNGMMTNIKDGYVMEQMITVKSKDVEHIAKLSKESTSLLKEGIELISYAPEYYFTKINDMKIEILGAASKDAFLRAKKMAESSGSSIGGLKSARQGVFQITPLYSADVEDYGINDLSSIDKMVKAVVTIEYFVED